MMWATTEYTDVSLGQPTTIVLLPQQSPFTAQTNPQITFSTLQGSVIQLVPSPSVANELSVSSTALGLVAASPLRPRLSQVALPSPTPPGLSFSHRSSTTSTGLSRSYQSPRAPNVGSPKARPRARVAAIATCDAEKSDRDLTGNVDSTESQEKHPTINEKNDPVMGKGAKNTGDIPSARPIHGTCSIRQIESSSRREAATPSTLPPLAQRRPPHAVLERKK